VLRAVVRVLPEVKAAVDNLVVDVAEAVDVEAAVDVTVVLPEVRRVLSSQPERSFL
jgi:hypothetical protein